MTSGFSLQRPFWVSRKRWLAELAGCLHHRHRPGSMPTRRSIGRRSWTGKTLANEAASARFSTVRRFLSR